jgi:DNA-binding NarL/FixJ family response regulator
MPGYRILIVDDHALLRRGLRQVILEAFPTATCEEANNASEALERVWRGGLDAVLLDIGMPGRDGMEVLKEIKRATPNLPVLVLSAHSEDQFAVRAIKAGAAGYLTKGALSDDLVKGLRKILTGGKFVTPSVAEKLAAAIDDRAELPPHEVLSNREYEVLRLIAAGKTVGQAATQLSLSVKTISTYRTRILGKLNLKNNADLMRYGIERGL